MQASKNWFPYSPSFVISFQLFYSRSTSRLGKSLIISHFIPNSCYLLTVFPFDFGYWTSCILGILAIHSCLEGDNKMHPIAGSWESRLSKHFYPRGQNLNHTEKVGYICPTFRKSVLLVQIFFDTIRSIVSAFVQIFENLRSDSIRKRAWTAYSKCSN